MAGGTVRPEFTGMAVILAMAGITKLRCTRKDAIDMATLTRQPHVFAFQKENELVVVEGKRSPVHGGVTVATQRTEIPFMRVIRGMAGIAVAGCP